MDSSTRPFVNTWQNDDAAAGAVVELQDIYIYFFFFKKKEEEYFQSRIVTTRHSRMYIYLSYSGDRRREVVIRFESTCIIILQSHMGLFYSFSFYKFYKYIRNQATHHEFRFTEFILIQINKVTS